MAPHAHATCLATILAISERGTSYEASSSAVAFNFVQTGRSVLRTSITASSRPRARVRPRPASSQSAATPTSTSADKPDDGESRRAVSPPGRITHPDIDKSSLNWALSTLDASLAQAPSAQLSTPMSGSRAKRETRNDEGNLDASGHTCNPRRSSQRDFVAETQRLVVRGRIAEAIVLLATTGTCDAASPLEIPTRADSATALTTTSSATSEKEPEINKASLRIGFLAVLKGCADRRMWQEAWQVVTKHMPNAGIKLSTEAWVLAIEACPGSEQAVSLLHELRSRGVPLEPPMYEVAIRACTRGGAISRAIFLLKDAAKRGTPISPATIANVMRPLTNTGDGWQHALSLFDTFLELVVNGGHDNDPLNDQDAVPQAVRRMQIFSDSGPKLGDVCQAALDACVRGGQWERALEVLNILRACGRENKLSKVAYDKAIHVCGKARAWDMVLLLVAEMCADDIAPSPLTFETALQGCAAIGSWSWARSLMRSTSKGGIDSATLSARHYINALCACAAVVDKPGGKQAQAAVKFALDLVQDLRDADLLRGTTGEEAFLCAMQTCVKAQDAWSALALLESAPDDGVALDVPLRTAAMQALSGAGEWRAALSVLDEMLEDELQPGSMAYVAAMAACARGGMVDLALDLLEKVLEEHPGDKEVWRFSQILTESSVTAPAACACGVKTVSAAYGGAIKACAECGHWEEATSLLRRMRQDPLAVATVTEFNTAILACCRARQSYAALTLLGDLSMGAGANQEGDSGQSDLKPNEMSYNYVMRVFAQEGRSPIVMSLFMSMREEGGLTPGVSSYNILIESLAKAGKWQQTLRLLQEMENNGVRPTEFTYTCCMTACGKQGQWEETLSLLSKMKEQEDLVPDSYTFSTAMLACSRAGRLDDVLNILDDMRTIPGAGGPSVFHYNIAIGACARASDWERMQREIERMKWEDVTPTEATFAAAMVACGRAGNLPLALDLLAQLHAYKISPDVAIYSTVVVAACRAGDTRSVKLLLDEMFEVGRPPDEVSYAVTTMACRDAANADAAIILNQSRKAQGFPPDPVICGFAVQACFKAGDGKRGIEIVREMKAEGVTPDSTFYTSVIAGVCASFQPDGDR